jgi:hypothetical protein
MRCSGYWVGGGLGPGDESEVRLDLLLQDVRHLRVSSEEIQGES